MNFYAVSRPILTGGTAVRLPPAHGLDRPVQPAVLVEALSDLL